MLREFQFVTIALFVGSMSLPTLTACDAGDGGGGSTLGDVAVDSIADADDATDDGGPMVVPDAVTGPDCTGDEQCPAGQLCDPYRTVCTPECSTIQDCPSWIFCVLRPGRGGRICTPRPPGEVYSIEFAGDDCTAGAARCQRTLSTGDSLTMEARILAGNTAVESTRVQFEIVSSGGTNASISPSVATTNTEGIATTTFNAGDTQGIVDAQATLPGGAPITWKITIQSQ